MSKSGGFGDFSFQFPVKGELESVRGLKGREAGSQSPGQGKTYQAGGQSG